MTIAVYLGVPGLADVGYQFRNSDESANGSRITAGVSDAGGGWYSVANATLPLGASSVRWNSAGDANIAAREYFTAPTDPPGVTTLLSRIASVLMITGGRVDVNDRTGFSLTAAYDPAKTAAQAGNPVTVSVNNDKTGYILDPAQILAIADGILKRDWIAVSGEASESLLNALRAVRNRWELTTDGTLRVYREDGTSIAWQRSIQTDPNAKPIVGAN